MGHKYIFFPFATPPLVTETSKLSGAMLNSD